VLTGHEHHHSRTKQLAHGSGCAALAPGSYTASCVVDADASLSAETLGARFVGTSGARSTTCGQVRPAEVLALGAGPLVVGVGPGPVQVGPPVEGSLHRFARLTLTLAPSAMLRTGRRPP